MDECQIGGWVVRVGDVVQFKELDEIFNEFGRYNREGVINERTTGLHAGFARGMEPMCGKTFTIRSIEARADGFRFRSTENIEDAPERFAGHWAISDSMIKPYGEPNETDVREDDFLAFLLGG